MFLPRDESGGAASGGGDVRRCPGNLPVVALGASTFHCPEDTRHPAAWAGAATPEQHETARRLFRTVVINDKRVQRVISQPDFAVFFRCVLERPVGFGGSDGDRLREIDAISPPLVPILYPARALQSRKRGGTGRYAGGSKPRRIPEERWTEVVERARSEGLRSIARDFGVSHETVRAGLRVATMGSQAE